MRKLIIFFFMILSLIILFVFSCSKSDSPTKPAVSTPTIIPTATFLPTSTPPPSPNISGTLFLPAAAYGKQFIVIADNDDNTANGYTASMNGICPNSTSINYSMLVSSGSYYIYAFVDIDGTGLAAVDGLDYFGMFPNQITTPNNGVNISLNQLPIIVTLNVTLPYSVPGHPGFFGLFTNKDYSIINTGPIAGTTNFSCPSGTNFQVSFNVDPADVGTYYLIGLVDATGGCSGSGPCFPKEGDFIKIYGGSGVNWPASPNVTINNDITLNLSLTTVVPNVSGTAYLPSSVSNKQYTIFVSTLPMGANNMSSAVILTKTATASGNNVNYGIFVPFAGMHYITFIMDMDGSGWNNPPDNRPVSDGDYAGIYGVPTPILNWGWPYPSTPNANLPGTGFNIYCDVYSSTLPSTPTPIPTPTPGGATGNITVNLNIPSNQIGKSIGVIVDMDLNPTNSNKIAGATATVTSTSYQFTFTNIPVGQYYIYAATTSSNGPPIAGDAVGIYGSIFPNFPSSANANVTNGGILNVNITMVIASNNVFGRVYMPNSCPIGNQWFVAIDNDLDFENGILAYKTGAINNSNNYFDYSMFLPLPGNYYIYSFVDYTGDDDIGCGDFIGFYNFPNPINMNPANNYTNININTYDWLGCP